MVLKEIYKVLKSEGEVKVNDIELVWDGFGVEVSKGNEYQFTASTWGETKEFLLENGIDH